MRRSQLCFMMRSKMEAVPPPAEDGGGSTTREAIRSRFGDTVTAIVDGCTDSDMTPKPPSRHPKEAYIARILTASG